jgi:hypothetical protein
MLHAIFTSNLDSMQLQGTQRQQRVLLLCLLQGMCNSSVLQLV